MLTRPGKQVAEETEVREQALLAHLEHAVFGDRPTIKDGELSELELWWSRHYRWLKDRGYLLRPRYAPDWVPSWHGTKKSWVLCEDGYAAPVSAKLVRQFCQVYPRDCEYATRILDGTRISDGKYVTLKLIDKTHYPHEVDIAQYLSSQPLAISVNHCVPVYDILPIPDEENRTIIVMPLLQEYLRPPFGTVGEVVECLRQLFEVGSLLAPFSSY